MAYKKVTKVIPVGCLDRNEHDENVMGYTMRVEQYRFTEWVRFNRTTAVPNWDEVWGTELYNYTQQAVF